MDLRRYDLDGDGWVGRAELEDLGLAVLELHSQQAALQHTARLELRQRVDRLLQATNAVNGRISREAFIEFCRPNV